MKNNWVISGFVLASVIFIVAVIYFFFYLRQIRQIYRFKQQNLSVFSNKNSLFWILFSYCGVMFFYVLTLVFFVLSLTQKSYESYVIIFGILFLVEAIFVILALIFNNIWGNSVLIAVKNQNLITISGVVPFNNLLKVFLSKKKRFYIINYKDSKIKGNVEEIKIRYSFQLKDFLIANGIKLS